MKHVRFLILTVVVLVMGACGSSEPFKHVVFANSPEMFNAIVPVDGASGSGYITEDISYYIVFDDENRNATLTVNNLVVKPGGESRLATFDNIEWTYEPGSHETRRIIQADVLPSSDEASSQVTLTDVTIIYIESNDMNVENTAGFYASYTVDGAYRITSYPYAVCADGTTTVRTLGRSMNSEIDYEPVYIVRFNPVDMTAQIDARGVRLDDQTCDFNITGLTLGLVPDGYTLKSVASTCLEPIDGSVAPRLLSLDADAKLRDELNMRFELETDSAVYEVECYLAPDLSTLKP